MTSWNPEGVQRGIADTSLGVVLSIKNPTLLDIVEIALRLEGVLVLENPKKSPALLLADPDGFARAKESAETGVTSGRTLLLLNDEAEIIEGTEYLVIPKTRDEYDLDPELLIRKVRQMLAGHRPQAENNPVTGLPGEAAFEAELWERINSGERFGVLFSDINQFKNYNVGYSYARGDNMLRALGELMNNVMTRHPHPQNFLSHLGSDDFALITSEKLAPVMAEEIVDEFDDTVASFYDVADLARGYLILTDRKGNETHSTLVTIAIAAVLSSKRRVSHPAEVLDVAEELLAMLKSRDITESCCIVERPESPVE